MTLYQPSHTNLSSKSHTGLERPSSRFIKRTFDLVGACFGLLLLWWVIALAWVAASMEFRRNGFFIQKRVGMNGRLFSLVKIRTMREIGGVSTTVTCANDPRITRLGRILRRTKIDELPQLCNVLIGDMSIVGPRPDIKGFADLLQGEQRLLLSVRPGITGPATLKYRREEEILNNLTDPETYNRTVIWPDKVRINVNYVKNWSFRQDLKYIWRTLVK
ncbi:sugar transferase [Halomonas daqiaonensis]|uniref:Sugar transferase involved in LPS biosynthesis (Colanic, teichoic acid) n=1 Tax=Halomonas daqiaonensis TaxID=650850 RepID=A0A1H7HJU4_9GAMM|nr:sugar transferase [Halomonas daqiaonensis]SEK48525.1 Sugar transferase involved in LPS biosynthesis (colanic, teichoic acid) [Halomonas daqiaonensis]